MGERKEALMTPEEQYLRNCETFGRLRERIDREYPVGWFVAIADEKVICAADSYEAMVRAIREQGRDPREVSLVVAGKDYPEYVTFFL
jgi:hypothetical protein